MIYDGFAFNSEFECLKIRCEELRRLHPIHIMVECPWTHSGKPKPLHFQQRKAEFSQYRIVHKIFDRMDGIFTPWDLEKAQRNFIMDGMISGDDVLLITDADEIPRASAISNWNGDCAMLDMTSYQYYVNRQPCPGRWLSGRIVAGRYAMIKPLSAIRNEGCPETIPSAGWHFSWMGGVERAIEKLEAAAETGWNTPHRHTSIHWAIEFAKMPYHPLDNSYPEYLLSHQDEFRQMIHP